MDTKIFELRAPATLIVLMAIKMHVYNEAERYLMTRSGYGRSNYDFNKYIMVFPIDGGGKSLATTDAYKQTIEEIRLAHMYIIKHFDELEDGQVIDVEFITGKVNYPKTPERIELLEGDFL